ncbi:MAG: hypothetical protein ACRD19_09160 [Terriglobia bacterium]
MLQSLPYFENRIIRGDCVEVLRRLPAGSIDLVVTDPPYAARYRDRDRRTVANDDNTRCLRPALLKLPA